MDGVILVAIIIPLTIALFSFLVDLVNNTSGTKGISNKPYKTKSGKIHTADKTREDYIV